MSAAAQQTPAQRNAEPSMEEILASIRRIIAEDQKALEAKSNPQRAMAEIPAGDGEDMDDTLDLASIAPPLPAPVEAPAAAVPPAIALSVVEMPPPPVTGAVQPFAPHIPPHVAMREPVALEQGGAAVQPAGAMVASLAETVQAPLVSAATEYAASAAFQSLTNTVFTQQSKTMDELVSEMLRPMLTAWLDEHLPALVERLVKAEIERVARGGR